MAGFSTYLGPGRGIWHRRKYRRAELRAPGLRHMLPNCACSNHSSTVAARLLQLARAGSGDGARFRLGLVASVKKSPLPPGNARPRRSGGCPPGDMLLELAMMLMQRGEGESGTTLQKALWFRDGLMIAVLCFCAPGPATSPGRS